jgi:hypothetical protein
MTADACWDLLMHLPRDSALMAALAADPEFASEATPGPPPWTEFGPEVQALAELNDRVGALVSLVASIGGTKVKIPPYPRPTGPLERVRAVEKRQRHKALLARIGIGRE